jgi:hypothetical protein
MSIPIEMLPTIRASPSPERLSSIRYVASTEVSRNTVDDSLFDDETEFTPGISTQASSGLRHGVTPSKKRVGERIKDVFLGRLLKSIRANRQARIRCPAFEDIDKQLEPYLSRKDVKYDVEFVLKWELEKFVEHELGGSWELGPVLVVAGSFDEAFSTTAEIYIRSFWPKFGMDVLLAIETCMRPSG